MSIVSSAEPVTDVTANSGSALLICICCSLQVQKLVLPTVKLHVKQRVEADRGSHREDNGTREAE